MKKSLILVGLLSIGYAHAQQNDPYDGKVGVNTERPEKELHVMGGILADNEGLYSRRVDTDGSGAFLELNNPSKTEAGTYNRWRIYNMTKNYLNSLQIWGYGADGSYKSNLTLTDTGLLGVGNFFKGNEPTHRLHVDGNVRINGLPANAGADKDRVVVVDNNGVLKSVERSSLGSSSNELWAQRDVQGVTETYLKPASESGDEYMYSPKKSYINLGNAPMDIERAWIPSSTDQSQYSIKDRTPQLTMINDTAFKADDNSTNRTFSTDVYNLKTTKDKQGIVGKEFLSSAKDITSNISYVSGVNATTEFMSDKEAGTIQAARFDAMVGSERGHNPIVGRNIGLRSRAMQYSGTTDTMMGLFNETYVFGGNVNNIYGSQTNVYSTNQKNGAYPLLNLKYMVGNRVTMSTNPSTTVERHYGGIYYNYFRNNSTILIESSGIASAGYFEDGSNIKDYTGNYVYLNGTANATVEKLYGFRVNTGALTDGIKVKEMYGLYLGNINKGAEKSYAIYTNEGKVRFGDLPASTVATDKVVVVDASGVLKTVERANIGGGTQGITTEQDGIVGNEVLDATTGKGLVRAGSGTQADPYTLGIKDGGVTGAMLAPNAVTGDKIADAAITANKLGIPGTDGQVLTYKGNQWVAQAPQGGASLSTITGNISEVAVITEASWTAGVFGLIQTTAGGSLDLPSPANYSGRIIAVNNQSGTTLDFGKNSPANYSTIESGGGFLLMSSGSKWYVIGGGI